MTASYEIVTTTAYSKSVVAVFDSFSDAEAFAHANFKIVDFELDDTFDAADFYTADGVVYSINPL